MGLFSRKSDNGTPQIIKQPALRASARVPVATLAQTVPQDDSAPAKTSGSSAAAVPERSGIFGKTGVFAAFRADKTHSVDEAPVNRSRTLTDSPQPNPPVATRQTRQQIKSVEDLPPYADVLSVERGQIPLGPQYKAHIAVVQGADTYIYMVCTEEVLRTAVVSTLKQKIERVGRFGGFIEAPAHVVGSIYRKLDLPGDFAAGQLKKFGNGGTSNNEAAFLEILREAIKRKASDIHIECRMEASEPFAAVRFRVNGGVALYQRFSPETIVEMCGTVYNGPMVDPRSRSAGHNVWAKEHDCSCAVQIQDFDGAKVKLRWQQSSENRGFDIVLRILLSKGDTKPKSLVELGYAPNHVQSLEVASRSTVGLVAIAGITGSGKTTTINSLIMHHPKLKSSKTITIEDPVEYDMPGVTQIAVQRSMQDSGGKNPFKSAMTITMRMDPDIIMPGEIRDVETGELVQSMVQSGHKVFSTVHTSSAFAIPGRLSSSSIGLSREVMSSRNFISALVYQRLVPVLCPHCKLPSGQRLSQEMARHLTTKFRLNLESVHTRDPEGCEHCHEGIKGMTVCCEVVIPDLELLAMIRTGDDLAAEKAWRKTRRSGFDKEDAQGKLAIEHAIYKVSQGLCCPYDVEDTFDPFELHQTIRGENMTEN